MMVAINDKDLAAQIAASNAVTAELREATLNRVTEEWERITGDTDRPAISHMPQELRTAITLAISAGAHPNQIGERLGGKSPNSTTRFFTRWGLR